MLDVAVLVPATWGYGFAPKGDWCAQPGYMRPDAPFVDRNPTGQAIRSILCTQPMPDELRQTHLTWRVAQDGDADGVEDLGAWVRVSRVVGSAVLTVEVPAAEEAVAHEVLATARVVEPDPRGCPTTVGGEVAGLGRAAVADVSSVRSVVVCQYAELPGDGPNLVGSYELTGSAARAVRDALADPAAGAATPPACPPTREELLLRFNGGEAGARLPLDGCRTPVFSDGRARYEPTRATCADLLVGPLWKAAYANGRLAAVCGP